MCRGQCPGTSISGDWRNRTEHCGVWKALFEYFEQRLREVGETPFSLAPERERVEKLMVERWAQGQRPTMWSLREELHLLPPERGNGVNVPHADQPHQDWHRDHWDLDPLRGLKGVAPVGAP